MKHKLYLVLILCLVAKYLQAQYGYNRGEKLDQVSLGLGAGLDYGGLGANFLVYASRNVGLFGGAGYAFAGGGLNGGTKIRFWTRSTSNLHPYLIGMYGYNTAIAVSHAKWYNKFFYGPSIGIGTDCRSSSGNNYWSFALLIPIRSPEADRYITSLQNSGVTFSVPLLPFGFSIGYRLVAPRKD